MSAQTTSNIKVSHANFGGKNNSPFEFYNSSDVESASFFEKTSKIYNSFNGDERSVGDILKLYLDYFDLTNMIRDTNNWFIQNIKREFLSQLSGVDYTSETLAEFDFSKCTLSNVFKFILTKDKGVGGFEQINSNRPSNTIKHYKSLIDSSRNLQKKKFAENILNTYNLTNGTFVNPIEGKENSLFSNYFMKGRKEGPNKTTKNYYNENIIYTRNNSMHFKSVGCMILCLYDIITFEMASDITIPTSFNDNTCLIEEKTHLIEDYLKTNNIDIMFLTEYMYYNSFSNISDYTVILGESLDGLSNAIIYKKTLGELSIFEYPIPISNEFKEPPLVLENENMVLVCFHAGGRGILENVSKFTDTELYKYISDINSSKRVIVGGDFNCNIYDDCNIFGLGDNPNIAITTFKQRTSVQPQFDKTNKKDKSKKDDFVIRGYNIIDSNVTMLDGENIREVNGDCDDSYLLPNNNHPFDHFIVNYTLVEDSEDSEDSGSEEEHSDTEEEHSDTEELDSDTNADDYDGYYYLNYIYTFISSYFKSDN